MNTTQVGYQIMSKKIKDSDGIIYHKHDIISYDQLQRIMDVHSMVQVRVLVLPN